MRMRALLVLIVAALLMGSEAWPPAKAPAPLVGFSYSPLSSLYLNRDPVQDLGMLLAATEPDLVRLPVYWDAVQPSPSTLDYASVDDLLSVVERHNLLAARPTRVVLTIGARNFNYPELHAPAWVGPRQQPELGQAMGGPAYRLYFDSTIKRYRSSPLVYGWQVEDEPFDNTANVETGDDRISLAQLRWEVGEVHRLDRAHRAVTTSFDGWNALVDTLQIYAPSVLARLGGYPSGHPDAALAAGDALGLDFYIYGPSVPPWFISNQQRTEWKTQALAFWADRAAAQGKSVWLAEMQAQPWGGLSGFGPADLIASAGDYRREPLQVVLLWGVETWLTSPSWLAAAAQAMTVLRS